GCRKVLTVACAMMCATLPLLAGASTFLSLALALFVFGAGLGCADCAFNIQAIIVEAAAGKPLMSGFHGFYSVGAFSERPVSARFGHWGYRRSGARLPPLR